MSLFTWSTRGTRVQNFRKCKSVIIVIKLEISNFVEFKLKFSLDFILLSGSRKVCDRHMQPKRQLHTFWLWNAPIKISRCCPISARSYHIVWQVVSQWKFLHLYLLSEENCLSVCLNYRSIFELLNSKNIYYMLRKNASKTCWTHFWENAFFERKRERWNVSH